MAFYKRLSNMSKHPICFTVDVEDGISLSMRDNFNQLVEQTVRVVKSTTLILNILDKYQVKGTFFCLGQVGQKFPELIKDIATSGHEIAVHVFDHLTFDKMSPKKAFDEISSAKKLFEDLVGNKVTGHRAPAFSITPKTSWGLEVIESAGFKHDSSILPSNLGKYSWGGLLKDICLLKLENGRSLIEVPISTIKFLSKDIPFSGGGYFRLIPLWLIHRIFDSYAKSKTIIHYMHPYEVDAEPYPDFYFKALKKASPKTIIKLRSNWINRKYVPIKLSSILSSYSFMRMDEFVADSISKEKLNEVKI
jgi:polysaccharide deacetylase family protein (PEP-CTERM system associated)